jgi:hypothetical protein
MTIAVEEDTVMAVAMDAVVAVVLRRKIHLTKMHQHS